MNMRSRYLLELNTSEVVEYIKNGKSTAVLPVGCVEMHGLINRSAQIRLSRRLFL